MVSLIRYFPFQIATKRLSAFITLDYDTITLPRGRQHIAELSIPTEPSLSIDHPNLDFLLQYVRLYIGRSYLRPMGRIFLW